MIDPKPTQPPDTTGDPALIVPLAVCQMLPLVGGKAANLGELLRADFPVPPGFCLTTRAYALVSAEANLAKIFDALAATRSDDREQLTHLAESARIQLTDARVPASVVTALHAAYHQLGADDSAPVAIRSSATAEDLPFASFAGQQDTFLNVIGIDAVLAAVRHCWESLWSDRAVIYRASKSIDSRTVQLAVIVQRMVNAEAAGVLFTANPVTGKRRQAVIDASFGLGESVVSGLVNPDHFVVDQINGEIVERRPGDKRLSVQAVPGGGVRQEKPAPPSQNFSLSDAQVAALVRLGQEVEALFGLPQDIEWALDTKGDLWLTQARPITTLFPLPAPNSDDALRVYLSYNVQQGSYQPFTPAGIAATRLLASTIMAFAGFAVSDPLVGPGFVKETASRVFLDVTAALRTSLGRRLLMQVMAQAEAHAAAIFEELAADPRLSLQPISRAQLLRTAIRLLMRTRLLWYLPQTLLSPTRGRARLQAVEHALRDAEWVEPDAGAQACLSAVKIMVDQAMPRLIPAVVPAMLGSMIALSLAARLLGDHATNSEMQTILRGLPFNPTTEMTLALWQLARQVQADASTADFVRATSAEQLAQAYLHGNLPAVLQSGLEHFLTIYGHRSVNELDLGQPRWSENPAYILSLLASYLEVRDPAAAPPAQHQRAAREAEAMISELAVRAQQISWGRGLLVGFFLRRARALAGLREMPRDALALLLAQARSLLHRVGQELVTAGVLENPTDIFFLSLKEAQAALAGTDFRSAVTARRKNYQQEQTRQRVPLVLLSDGTEPAVAPRAEKSTERTLQGIPASPGAVTAAARIIFEPHGAQFSRGDILVAPSTDPGWTPLFLMASGLVMETGGEMSHGAIVAREYGIPAVVGATGATEQIRTGQPIRVDGSTGVIELEVSDS